MSGNKKQIICGSSPEDVKSKFYTMDKRRTRQGNIISIEKIPVADAWEITYFSWK